MKIIIISIVLALLAVQALEAKFNYKGYTLIRAFPNDEDQLEFIHKLEIADPEFDIWNVAMQSNPVSADILLSPKALRKYEKVFKIQKIRFDIVDSNIQNKIEEQERSMIRSKNERSIIFKYARYSEIMNFIDDTVDANPDIASSYIAGKTHENRNIKAIVLKTPTATRSIWIDCGIHAREWVSPSSCVYAIDQLIKEYRANEPGTSSILKKYEIHVVPLLNPDGYEFSHSFYRLWRKNKKPSTVLSCPGVDLNRNFPFRWLTGGSSTDPCSETYAGTSAGSELETKAVINSIQAKSGQWDAFLSIHSYGQWWLTQWGHSVSEFPPDFADIITRGKIGVDAIKAFNGSVFVIGSSARLLYINTGSSADWAKGAENIKYAYVLELRPGPDSPDYGYGFTLPEDRMPIVAPETYTGVKAFIKGILN